VCVCVCVSVCVCVLGCCWDAAAVDVDLDAAGPACEIARLLSEAALAALTWGL